MNINHLKVGDKIYIRDDLNNNESYDGHYFYGLEMENGEIEIEKKADYCIYFNNQCYTHSMIDWKKTEELNSSQKLPTNSDNYCDSCRNKDICNQKDNFNSIEVFWKMQDKKKMFSFTCDLYVEGK